MDSIVPNIGPTCRASLRCAVFQLTFTLLATLLLIMPLHAQDADRKRIALIIGNGAYENVAQLRNPKNDSADLAAELTSAGFQVDLYLDQDQSKMLDTLRAFRRKADGAEIALIYYAGHGIEIDRQNYLLPIDAVLETDADVNFEAVKLETLVFAASGAQRLSMVVVDACRDNPFATSMKRTNASRSIGRGLSAIEPSKNTLVAYAAKEGTTAADGAGRNSPYAAALIDALQQPDLEVGLMMRRVRDSVLKATAGKQEPFVYGSLSADPIYLNDSRGIIPATATSPVIVATDEGVSDIPDANAAEILFWKSIADTTKPSLLEAYLDLYPDGFFAELARAKIEKLGGSAASTVVASVQPPVIQAEPVVEVAPSVDLTRSLTREEMVELQERLSALGYSLGAADGIAGRRTEAAIRNYEKAENRAVLGLASVPVLKTLRDSISDTELKTWRSQQAARVEKAKATPQPFKAKAVARTKAVAKPKVTEPKVTTPKVVAPKVTPAPQPKVVTTKLTPKPSNKYKQFCGANRQCGTAECRAGSGGEFFKKTRNCKFCASYAERC